MIVNDVKLKVKVDVAEKACLKKSCYYAKPDYGIFNIGSGYQTRQNKINHYVCGTRENNGSCPS